MIFAASRSRRCLRSRPWPAASTRRADEITMDSELLYAKIEALSVRSQARLQP
jgi:hypothetical protein